MAENQYSRNQNTNSAPICMYKNNQKIWCHNCSILCLCDIIGQLWWCHNAWLEKNILGYNGEMSDPGLFLLATCVHE